MKERDSEKARKRARETEIERGRERDQEGCSGFKAVAAAVASEMKLE